MDNHAFGGADGFDFTLTPRTLDAFAAQCRELQTSPESSFVKTTVCERFVPHGLVMLRGAVLREVTASGVTTAVLTDAAAFERRAAGAVRLDLPDMADCWPRDLGTAPGVAGRAGAGQLAPR